MSVGTVATPREEAITSGVTSDWALRLSVVAAQIFLVAQVIRAFELEHKGLYHVLLLVLGGFLVHAFLPMRWRLPFFSALSLASIWMILGPVTFWVVGVGAFLVALCHLPVRFNLRLAIILAVAVGLAVLRKGSIVASPIPAEAWPVLGTFFMFRLALYLYSIKHNDAPTDFWRSVAYFFMLPNVCFVLYPIIDYKTFLRTYYDTEDIAIYQRGIRWMVRGVTHLLLYRAVYHFMAQDPAQVTDLMSLAQYCLSAYLIYLRLSGQFHLVIGVLHLFGFRLPETHHLYFLASSFTDLWRRINIYWKDFMMKLVYYPSFFWLRHRKVGNTACVMIATGFTMFLTWFFHGYQWYWLLGNSPLSALDALFWGALGLLVLFSTIYELKVPKVKGRTVPKWSLRRGLGTVMVFSTMCMLWTLWGSSSVSEFFRLLAVGGRGSAQDVAILAGIAVLGVVIGGRAWGSTSLGDLQPKLAPLSHDLSRGGLTCLALAGLLVIELPVARPVIGKRAADVVSVIGSSKLNRRDAAIQVRGYYEKLSVGDRRTGQVWETRMKWPDDWVDLRNTPAFHRRTDWQLEDLTPGASVVVKKMPFNVNSHGLHDHEYAIPKPPRTIRIGLFGPSSVMAAGVPEDSTFDNLIEVELNRKLGGNGIRYEVLNFGMDYYSTFQCVEMLRERGRLYQVDVALLFSHPPDRMPIVRQIDVALKRNAEIPYPELVALLKRVGIDSTSGEEEVHRRLGVDFPHVINLAVDAFGKVAGKMGARPMVVVLRLPSDPQNSEFEVANRAREQGWPVADLSEIYGSRDEAPYRFADYDHHLNLAGNRLVADSLSAALLRANTQFQLLTPVPAGSGPSTQEQP